MPPVARRCVVSAFALAALALAGGCARADPPPPSSQPPSDQAWVELTDRGAEARLITAKTSCPNLLVDGTSEQMTARAGPDADFPLSVCEAALPKGARAAAIGPQRLPLPAAQVQRVVIFGDTGCRLKGVAIQNCDRPADWPFAQVARLAAAHHPDLVIHVGDYYYRESPCPAGQAGCAGSPWGDNWASWNADFFAPAEPLLAAAPWVMVRGNHEDCARGGRGWFRLLDGAPTPLSCPAVSAPMAIDLGGLSLYVLDSAGTDDRSAPAPAVATFAAQLDVLKTKPPPGPAWIITHRPIWGMAPVARAGPIGPFELPLNVTEQAAAKGRDLSGVAMVVSGHIHHFASFAFDGDRPPQLIVGTGGDVGEPGDAPRFIDGKVNLDGMTARRFGFERYGFLVLDRTGGDGWSGDFYDVRDQPIASCRLVGRKLDCRAAKPRQP
ncbi:MAG TPA: metallophosphoesterase [Caulobacteraceae bacterium]|nr:metallophosphoesterase [Caulobacteraceae bacterium]